MAAKMGAKTAIVGALGSDQVVTSGDQLSS
jgi:hypothetical protein